MFLAIPALGAMADSSGSRDNDVPVHRSEFYAMIASLSKTAVEASSDRSIVSLTEAPVTRARYGGTDAVDCVGGAAGFPNLGGLSYGISLADHLVHE
ncbi:hypothetical protein Pmar_PMAR018373 [Perkinsus marinus ATCC 50983]|uniref:Uncharacterized protein n=1 Tax=Perkinsus marinus (strain ATCC 50983 / TXsc) TaxID=423536 RepID=C5LS18_PERM5|nr:hypothetical protein Pmar_PMAR018373 [Perkinsus marinus ATCC 50983]EER00490.1 hypothetical protein Pmar_PMAR018373 [Perkinsus marinus ATCC 50983]|eukprot:XP_002767772.1 hypothetical protein Pmar_PMAR018373 [Perkinsus marinus ATCC 50983]